MALDKSDINNALKQESVKSRVRRRKRKKYRYVTTKGVDAEGFEYTLTQRVEIDNNSSPSSVAAKANKAQEDTLVKNATKLGRKDGEVLGGVKSLGKDTIAAGETTLNTSVGKVTDGVGKLTGTKSPKSALGSMTGLPAQTAGDTASAAIEVVGATGPQSIASSVEVAKSKKNAAALDVQTFANTIADATEQANMNIPSVDFGSLENTVKNVSPVGNISGKISDTKDTVKNATGISALTSQSPVSKNALTNFKDAGSVIKSGLKDVKSAVNDFGNTVTNFINDVNKRFDNGLQSGFLQNFGETIGGSAKASIAGIVPGGISLNKKEYDQTFKEITSGKPKDKANAVKRVVNKSENVTPRMKEISQSVDAETTLELQNEVQDEARRQGVPEAEISDYTNEVATVETGLDKIDTTIAGTFVVDADMFGDAPTISDNNQRWSGRSSPDDVFTYVSSVEELDTEMSNISRVVTEVIVHATETFTNKNIGSIEINNIHKELGHDGIGFHYVIRRDGRLQRGRPVNRQGEHAPVNGHDKNSIGIVMVGGIDSPVGSEDIRRSAGSFTRAQYTTLEQFLGAFYRQFPGGQVFGHSDVDANELDPYFDVIAFVESIFRKKNVVGDTLNSQSIEPNFVVKSVDLESIGRTIVFNDVTSLLESGDESISGSAVRNTEVIEPDGDPAPQDKAILQDTSRPSPPTKGSDGQDVPRTDPDGTRHYFEWDEEDGEWLQVEDLSDYEPEPEEPSTNTRLYGDILQSDDISLDDI